MIAELAVVTEQLAAMTEERDHYKRELGLIRDQEAESRLKQRLAVTPRQATLLMTLYNRRGRVVSKVSLADAIYGDLDPADPQIMNVFICRVRKRLPTDCIETVGSRGWTLTEAGVAAVEQALMVAQ